MEQVINLLTSNGYKVISQAEGSVTASDVDLIITVAQLGTDQFKMLKTFKENGLTEYANDYTFEEVANEF